MQSKSVVPDPDTVGTIPLEIQTQTLSFMVTGDCIAESGISELEKVVFLFELDFFLFRNSDCLRFSIWI